MIIHWFKADDNGWCFDWDSHSNIQHWTLVTQTILHGAKLFDGHSPLSTLNVVDTLLLLGSHTSNSTVKEKYILMHTKLIHCFLLILFGVSSATISILAAPVGVDEPRISGIDGLPLNVSTLHTLFKFQLLINFL